MSTGHCGYNTAPSRRCQTPGLQPRKLARLPVGSASPSRDLALSPPAGSIFGSSGESPPITCRAQFYACDLLTCGGGSFVHTCSCDRPRHPRCQSRIRLFRLPTSGRADSSPTRRLAYLADAIHVPPPRNRTGSRLPLPRASI